MEHPSGPGGIRRPWHVVDLCTGGGLFAEGVQRAGGLLRLCIDIDTYTAQGRVRPLGAVASSKAAGHPAVAGDIGDLTLYRGLTTERSALGDAAPPLIVVGGPPCQPFSTAGKRAGAGDARDAFPAALAAIDRLQPRRVVLENVRGILSHRGKCPGKRRSEAELQADAVDYETAMGLNCPACYLHRHLLPEMRKRFAFAGYWLLDAADFGVPQRRWRVFMWGAEVDLGPGPQATHSAEALVYAKWVSGSYWAEHGLVVGGDGVVAEMHRSRKGPGNGTQPEATSVDAPSVTLSGAAGGSTRPQLTERDYPTPIAKWEERLLRRIQAGQVDPARLQMQRWRTMRDALPALGGKGNQYITAIGGGRNPGHGSPNSPRSFRELADEPSPAMTAVQVGNRGPWLATHCRDQKHATKKHPDTTVAEPCRTIRSGGSGHDAPALHLKRIPREPERPDAPINRRPLSPEECALIQSAPPDYPWQGNKTQRYRQIGNAVPVPLAEVVFAAATIGPQ